MRLSCRNHEAYSQNGLDIHGVTVGFLKLSYKMFQRLNYIFSSVLQCCFSLMFRLVLATDSNC